MKRQIRKVLALFLVLAMVIGAVPVYTFATDTPSLALKKTVTAVSDDCLSYDINLSVTGTVPSTISTFDVVLILDTSGSMRGTPLNRLKTAAKSFIDKVAQYNANCRIGLVSYGSSATNRSDLRNLSSSNINTLKRQIDNLWANGGTNLQSAIEIARNMLGSGNDKKYIIVMSDGVANDPYGKSNGNTTINGVKLVDKRNELNRGFDPDPSVRSYTQSQIDNEISYEYPTWHTYNTAAAVLQAEMAKNRNITVYAVGMLNKLKNGESDILFESSQRVKASYRVGKDTLLKVSSGDGYFYEADESTVETIYKAIAQQIILSITVTDVINTDDFDIVGTPTATAGTVTVENGTLTWTANGDQYKSSMSATVRVKAKQRFETQDGRVIKTLSYTANTNVGQANLALTMGSDTTNIQADSVADVTIPGFSVTAATTNGQTKFNSGEDVTLKATPSILAGRCENEMISYTWTEVGGDWTSDSQQPTFTITDDTILIVTAVTAAGHKASAVVELTTYKDVGIKVTKSIASPTDLEKIKIGDEVIYKVEVSNTSADSQKITDLVVEDNLTGIDGPYVDMECTTAEDWPEELDADQTETRYYKYTVDSEQVEDGKITNTVTATGESDGQTVSDTSSVDFNIYTPKSNLSVNKMVKDADGEWADSATFYNDDSVEVLYKIEVTNSGDAEGTFTLSDLFGDTNVTELYADEELTTEADIADVSIAAGETLTFYFSGTIESGESITNTVTVETEQEDTAYLTDSVTVNVMATEKVILSVDKFVAIGVYDENNDDVDWQKDVEKVLSSADATEDVTFKIVVSATFPETEDNIYVSVNLSDVLNDQPIILDGENATLILGFSNTGEGPTSYTFYITRTLGVGAHTNTAAISEASLDASERYKAEIDTSSSTATVTLTAPTPSEPTSEPTSSTPSSSTPSSTPSSIPSSSVPSSAPSSSEPSNTPLTVNDPGAVSPTTASTTAPTVVIPDTSVPMAAPSSEVEAVVISEESVPQTSPKTGVESSATAYAVVTLLTSGIALTIFARRKKEDK